MERTFKTGRPCKNSESPPAYQRDHPVNKENSHQIESRFRSKKSDTCQELKNCKVGRPVPPPSYHSSHSLKVPEANSKSSRSRSPSPHKPRSPRSSFPLPKSPVPVRYKKQKSTSEGGMPAGNAFVMDSLGRGVIVNLYTQKKKTEIMTLCLWSNLGEIVFVRSLSSKAFITVKLEEVKEICKDSRQRLNRNSEDFLPREVSEPIITILYGTSFMPEMVSFSLQKNKSQDDIDFQGLYYGLQVAVKKCQGGNYYEQRERWFHREFDKLRSIDVASQKSKENKISLTHIKAWFGQHSVEKSTQYLTLKQKKLMLPDYLDIEAFSILVNDILTTNLVDHIMKEYGTNSGSKRYMTPESFEAFLVKEQKEKDVYPRGTMAKMLTCFPPDQNQDNLVFSERLFENYLFSDTNSILNPCQREVNQDMDKTLSSYWIASSHNTYLVGGQWKGMSSVETYARCLRMGCRCLELDCWDGPDGRPIITHGKTLTSKIRVADVLHTIKEHAWLVSDFPLILSIENHCNLVQQRVLASLFKEIFQDELLTEPVDPNETALPSPNQLKRKVIIKNKKLQMDGKILDTKGGIDIMDQIDIKKNGTLSMKYDTEKVWHQFEFALGESHVCFSPVQDVEEDCTQEENIQDYFEGYESDDEGSEEEKALNSQLWYHGKLNRKAAEEIIEEKKSHGDGTFLVRDSDQGGYAVSFFCQQMYFHSRIQSRKDEAGKREYLIGNEVWHKSVPGLVKFYKEHKLSYRANMYSLPLTFPICKKFDFFNESWYKPMLDRPTSESMLNLTPIDGVFLVRPSSMDNSFSLSFRHNLSISHFQIQYVNNKFVLSNYRFSTMESLISYFQKHPLYGTVKLSVAATDDLADGDFYEDMQLYDEDLYTSPQEAKRVTVRALYDFHASTHEELSFKRGSNITNVVIEDQPWWKGDHGGERQKSFPSNYVQLIDEVGEEAERRKPNEAVLHLSMCHIESNIQVKDGIHYFLLSHTHQPGMLMIGSRCLKTLNDWISSILETADKVTNHTHELQKQERSKNIAQELSDLIVYCQAVVYNPSNKVKYCEMSSFSEEKIGKDDQTMIRYNLKQISRVYPKYLRVSSTNYDPIPKWNVGCHMAALNYQTPDRSMQINQAQFLQNGRCGYVLKPDFMLSPNYSPANVKSLTGVESVVLTVKVLGGRNLCAGGSGVAVSRPFVVVEVLGLPLDNQKERTRMSSENSLNPVWKRNVFVFNISCPELAFLRFEVFSENNNDRCLSQSTLPVPCILQGYRSVQLQNGYSENLPMSTLLVHIGVKYPKSSTDIKKVEQEEKNLFRIIEETRRLYNELSMSNSDEDERKREQLQQTERKLLEYLDQTKKQGNRRTWVY